MESINPYTQQLVENHPEDSDSTVKEKLELAQKAFEEHRWHPMEKRAQRMKAAGEVLRKNKREYGEMMTREMGKPIKEAIAEVEKCAWVCDYYADNAPKFLKKEIVETDAWKSYVSYEPIGAVLAVMPWNFPFWQVFRFAAPNLMAGNVGLLKHANNVQGSAKLIQQVFEEAGFEKGVFQNLCVEVPKVEGILRNPIVKAATVTGSEKAGAAVASVCGEEIKPTVLELGGSNAFIVLKDADLQKAAKLAVKARMLNNGQSCIASKRFIVEESVHDQFLEAFKTEMEKLKVGDPMKEDTEVGPVQSEKAAKGLEEQLQKSLDAGAKLICGGKREKAFLYPTIIGNVRPGMPAFEEELFGPIASVISAKDENEAIEMANNTPFGLGASIITKDVEKAERLSHLIEDGAVFINELVKSDPRMPFGGTKKSGYGRELSHHGIHEFINAKTVHIKKEIGG